MHLGSIVPRYGALTVANAQVFGAGIELAPGQLRASASYGTLFRAVPADTSTGRAGSYARTLWNVRLGAEMSDQSTIGVTVAYMNDDEGSIPYITQETPVTVPIVDTNGVALRDSVINFTQRNPLLGMPQEGAALGIDFKSQLGQGFHTSGELALTTFTRDKTAPSLEEGFPVVGSILTSRTSTRFDAAGKIEIGFRDTDWGLSLGALYVGPGFVVLSQPYFQSDRIDINFSPSVRLFSGLLQANGTVGYRINDMSNMLTAGSTQMLLAIQTVATISEGLTLSGSFTNFGYRTTRAEDTLRYEQVSNSFSLMPSYILVADSMRHMMSVSFSNDAFSDLTQQNVNSSANTTTAYLLMYGLSPVSATWMARATISIVQNDLALVKTTMRSGTVSGTYRAFNGRFEPEAAFTYSMNQIVGLPEETQLTLRAGCRAKIVPSVHVFANVQWTDVASDESANGRAYSETLGTFGVRWTF